ncbi:MAG: hypothetical protein R3D00_28350 [Bacteroidia bacterium]
MMNEKNQSNLRDALQKLPVYKPDNQVWNQIEKSLAEEDAGRKPVIRRFIPVPFKMAHLAAAATVLLLLTAGALWLFRPQSSIPANAATFSEKELDRALPLSKAEITEYEHQLASQEEELKNCIEKLPDQESEKIQPVMEMLQSITKVRDSMIRLLDEQGDNPGTVKRLQSLEKKRKALILELREKACGIRE